MTFRIKPDEKAPLWSTLMDTVIGLALLLSTPIFAWATVRNLATALDSGSWPQAQATITDGRIVRRSHGRVETWDPEVEYRFDVNDKTYTGNRIAYRGYGTIRRSPAEAILQRFAVGSQHPVWYDPASPGHCVLDPGVRWIDWAALLMPIITLTVGGAMSYEHLRFFLRRCSGNEMFGAD